LSIADCMRLKQAGNPRKHFHGTTAEPQISLLPSPGFLSKVKLRLHPLIFVRSSFIFLGWPKVHDSLPSR
jgi:hypothetical protein